eukprot:817282-Rhodomonas_salina.4
MEICVPTSGEPTSQDVHEDVKLRGSPKPMPPTAVTERYQEAKSWWHVRRSLSRLHIARRSNTQRQEQQARGELSTPRHAQDPGEEDPRSQAVWWVNGHGPGSGTKDNRRAKPKPAVAPAPPLFSLTVVLDSQNLGTRKKASDVRSINTLQGCSIERAEIDRRKWA